MFLAEGLQADIEFREQQELDNVIAALENKDYHPVLKSMLGAACAAASISKYSISAGLLIDRRSLTPFTAGSNVPGEIFFKEKSAYILQPMSHRLHIWEIRHHMAESFLSTFGTELEQAIRNNLDGRRVRGMNFKWRSFKIKSLLLLRRYGREVKLDSKPAEYTESEIESVKLFSIPETRAFMLRLAQVSKIRASDAISDIDTALIEKLLSYELIRKEYLVQCKKDSHTICKIQDPIELQEKPGTDFTCTVCGRSFKDELIQEIYALSEKGKKLLFGSKWMTIWITQLLVAAGISKEAISWNASASEDELDIVIEMLGLRIFFELKDREFGLGDAYPFGYRISRYGGAFGLITTMDKVADEAKKFFTEQKPNMRAEIFFLEGQNAIEKELPTVVDSISRKGITILLSDLAESLLFDPRRLINAWMEKVNKESFKTPES